MHSLAPETDVRAMNVVLDDARLVVDLMDGRTIAVPLADIRGQTTVFLKTLSFSRGAGFFP